MNVSRVEVLRTIIRDWLIGSGRLPVSTISCHVAGCPSHRTNQGWDNRSRSQRPIAAAGQSPCPLGSFKSFAGIGKSRQSIVCGSAWARMSAASFFPRGRDRCAAPPLLKGIRSRGRSDRRGRTQRSMGCGTHIAHLLRSGVPVHVVSARATPIRGHVGHLRAFAAWAARRRRRGG